MPHAKSECEFWLLVLNSKVWVSQYHLFCFKVVLLKTEPMQLQFYTKPDCPLCDEAKVVLQSIGAKTSFVTIEEIDITKNLGIFTKYKYLIPVLELDGQQLFVLHARYWKLMWQLRWHRFRKFLAKFAS